MQKQIRPNLDQDIGEEFAEYCRTHGLIMGVAATKAIALWLRQQKRKTSLSVVEKEAIAS